MPIPPIPPIPSHWIKIGDGLKPKKETSTAVKLSAMTTAQRDALSPLDGMMIFNITNNRIEQYLSSTWSALGGGSGSSPLTTKGDLYGYDTANARIPIGSNGQVLKADSSEALGLKWDNYGDIDGGSYNDTYVNTSDINGGSY